MRIYEYYQAPCGRLRTGGLIAILPGQSISKVSGLRKLGETKENLPVIHLQDDHKDPDPQQPGAPEAGSGVSDNGAAENAADNVKESRFDVDALLAKPRDTADRRAEAFLTDWMRRFSRA